jgi:hypothetical protein
MSSSGTTEDFAGFFGAGRLNFIVESFVGLFLLPFISCL